MELHKVKAIVTGAGSGMGLHFAIRLAEHGAQVAGGDIDEGGLKQLPSSVHRRRLDVRSSKDIAEFTRWAGEAMGGLNVVISNAGILRDGLLVKRDKESGAVVTMPDEQFESVISVNLIGATYVIREGVAEMVRRGERGVVIAMSSAARHGNRGQSNYVSAKAALAANALTWAREFAPFGIRAVAIAPGMVETPMTRGMNPKAREAIIERIPVGRIGTPEDIWLGVRFAIECEYLNGVTIDIDGGLRL
ncbi:MAG: SDR family oxidoreductase [Sandaracinaceae bacterium]|nr:SDR family oxidoreductase [Sandaracinaceae bacterium]MDW8246301.1 SDR family oxidoreductase [Sandaracinaceae bacterium]